MEYFRENFEDSLETAAEALEENGETVLGYQAFIARSSGDRLWNFSDSSPLEALDKTLEELRDEERVEVIFTGDELADVINPGSGPEEAFYSIFRGGIEIEEPRPDEDVAGDRPAFGTIIHYIPDINEGYIKVGTAETLPQYTKEDAEEHVESIITYLNEAGFETEVGYIE